MNTLGRSSTDLPVIPGLKTIDPSVRLKNFYDKHMKTEQVPFNYKENESKAFIRIEQAVMDIYSRGLQEDENKKRETMQHEGFVKPKDYTPAMRDALWSQQSEHPSNPEADDSEDEGYDFVGLFILSSNSFIHVFFGPVYVLACLLSSYTYIWYAAFGS